jgi:hypothetical protein
MVISDTITNAARIPNILAYAVGCATVAFALTQGSVSCQTCATIFWIVVCLFPFVVVLCMVTPRKVPHRFKPIAVGFVGLVLSTLLLH